MRNPETDHFRMAHSAGQGSAIRFTENDKAAIPPERYSEKRYRNPTG
jgi:hypothetical protein